MATEPSFQRINYQLRHNKMVERKILFDVLRSTEVVAPLRSHKYLGFGSIWFVDFLYAHRQLGIQELTSMEHSEWADRAIFNRPYEAITVTPGTSHELLPAYGPEDWEVPIVAWFDYDGLLTSDVADDLRISLEHLQPGSLVFATVNADRRSYRSEVHGQSSAEAVKEALSGEYFDPAVVTTPGKVPDISLTDFPAVLASALLAYMSSRVVASSREAEGELLQFVPLFNSLHQDGAEMVTVGGVICKSSSASDYRSSVAHLIEFDDHEPVQQRFDMLALTTKEKMALDSLLPASDAAEFARRAKSLGVAIPEKDIEKYLRLYRYFPVFAEALV